MLRILSGKFKGRILKSPKTLATRPTQGVLRQALFNICQQRIEGARFLDLFAGSGAMGLEALSRNALKATFVEQSPLAIRCIRENIELLHVEEKSEVIPLDVFRALKQLKSSKALFELIYIDPPYEKASKIAKELLSALEGMIAQGGVVFLEDSSEEEELKELPPFLKQKDVRHFGIARLYQLEYIL